MSTTRKPLTATVRSWLDFDQKFLAVFAVFLVALVTDVCRLGAGQLTLLEAGAEVGPLLVAALGAYMATSTHREELETAERQVAAVVREVAPAVTVAAPNLAPVVGGVEDVLTALEESPALTTTTSVLPVG